MQLICTVSTLFQYKHAHIDFGTTLAWATTWKWTGRFAFVPELFPFPPARSEKWRENSGTSLVFATRLEYLTPDCGSTAILKSGSLFVCNIERDRREGGSLRGTNQGSVHLQWGTVFGAWSFSCYQSASCFAHPLHTFQRSMKSDRTAHTIQVHHGKCKSKRR